MYFSQQDKTLMYRALVAAMPGMLDAIPERSPEHAALHDRLMELKQRLSDRSSASCAELLIRAMNGNVDLKLAVAAARSEVGPGLYLAIQAECSTDDADDGDAAVVSQEYGRAGT